MKIVNGNERHRGGRPTKGTSDRETRILEAVSTGILSKADCTRADPETRHPGGRPTKRTPEITAKIAEAISYGMTNEQAAALAGIDDDTLTQWNKIAEFSGAIKSAVSTRLLARLKRIDVGLPGWQALAWFLERMYPEQFSRPEVRMNQQFLVNKQDNLSIWLHQGAPVALKDKEDGPIEIEDMELVCEAQSESQKALPYTSTADSSGIESMDLECDSEPARAAITDGDPRPGAGMVILAAHARRQHSFVAR